MRPLRLELTIALSKILGLLEMPGVELVAPTPATPSLLELVHDPAYVSAVRHAPASLLDASWHRYGLGTEDTPIFPKMHDAAALATGASVDAARSVWKGGADHAVNISGGLHHAHRSRAGGFCIYNDTAVAVSWLLAEGAGRVAYVDLDAHHGDGVQSAFYDDPRVLTISLHENGRALYPGTGWPAEIGGGAGVGCAVNVALPASTGDAGWLRAFTAVVPPLVRSFKPDILVTQCGCDTHKRDPLADLLLSVDGQAKSYEILHKLAHEVCAGKWLAVGGGGYATVTVVPRAWTRLIGEAVGKVVQGFTPNSWREMVRDRTGRYAPSSLTDGPAASYLRWEGGAGNPDASGIDELLDAAVLATRKAVFPLHGLDPFEPAPAE
ncbi:MAG: acetoin utilization protein AcuC [Frankiaceae bacterium]